MEPHPILSYPPADLQSFTPPQFLPVNFGSLEMLFIALLLLGPQMGGLLTSGQLVTGERRRLTDESCVDDY